MRRTAVVAMALGLVLGLAPPAWAEPAWLPYDQLFDTRAGLGHQEPTIVHDRSMTATAVWAEVDTDTSSRIMTATRRLGEEWSRPVALTPVGPGAGDTTAVIDHKGVITAMWVRRTQGWSRLQWARKVPGKTWTAPVTLSSGSWHAREPQLAVDSERRVTAVWWEETEDEQTQRLRTTRRAAAGGWSAPSTLTPASPAAYDVDLAVTDAGVWTAAWLQQDGADERVATSSRSWDSSWSEAELRSTAGQDASTPRVVSRGDDTHVFWRQHVGGSRRIDTTLRRANGSWGGVATLTDAWAHVDAGSFDVAPNPTGELMLVHAGYAGASDWRVLARHFVGGTWQPTDLVADTDSVRPVPRVAAAGPNAYVAVWRAPNVFGWQQKAAVTPDGGSWTVETPVADSGNFGHPWVYSDPLGNVSTIWNSNDGNAFLVGADYDNAGPLTSIVKPRGAFTTKTIFDVRWEGKDLSQVYGYDVEWAEVTVNGVVTPFQKWFDNTAAPREYWLDAETEGGTFCFRAKGRDEHGLAGPAFGQARCTAVPFDDRVMTAPGWQVQEDRKAFRDTVLTTARRGRELVVPDVAAGRLALLVTKVPGGGKVRVWHGDQRLGTFALGAARKKHKVVVPAGATTGGNADLRIKVVSSGSPVHIDGIYSLAEPPLP